MLERCEEKIMKDREEKRERGESGSVSFSLSLCLFPFWKMRGKEGISFEDLEQKGKTKEGGKKEVRERG